MRGAHAHYPAVSEVKVGKVFDTLREFRDGVGVSQIEEAVKFNRGSVNAALRILRERGIAACTYPIGGRFARWCELHNFERVRRLVVEDLERDQKLAAAREQVKRRKAAIARGEATDDGAGGTLIHRIRPAEECKPLKPRGPRSVFELAR